MDDGIEEDIVDHEDIALQEVETGLLASESAISASCQGIDKSIDTLKLEEYDYMEEVRPSS
jgi:hypothetical protein